MSILDIGITGESMRRVRRTNRVSHSASEHMKNGWNIATNEFFSASFLMVSQGYKEIPKTIRTNWTCLIVFEIGNEREVQVIYEEYAMGLKSEDWLELYKHATEADHSFLYINFQKPKKLRMMKNFTNYLFIE